MFVLTLTDDDLFKFMLIWGKSCVVFVWGEKLGCPRTPFIILLPHILAVLSTILINRKFSTNHVFVKFYALTVA